jgi:hypothetical protein
MLSSVQQEVVKGHFGVPILTKGGWKLGVEPAIPLLQIGANASGGGKESTSLLRVKASTAIATATKCMPKTHVPQA